MFTNYCVEIKFIINLLLSSMDVKEKKSRISYFIIVRLQFLQQLLLLLRFLTPIEHGISVTHLYHSLGLL